MPSQLPAGPKRSTRQSRATLHHNAAAGVRLEIMTGLAPRSHVGELHSATRTNQRHRRRANMSPLSEDHPKSVSARTVVRSERAPSTIFLGLDVHKESVTIAVLPSDAAAPTHLDKLAYDLKKIRRYLERLGPAATLQACYEASGAG